MESGGGISQTKQAVVITHGMLNPPPYELHFPGSGLPLSDKNERSLLISQSALIGLIIELSFYSVALLIYMYLFLRCCLMIRTLSVSTSYVSYVFL